MSSPILEYIQNDYVPISPDTRKPETGSPFDLEPFQTRILEHVFTPVLFRNERDPESGKIGVWRLPYRTFVYSCCKKSGKTALGGGVMAAWSRTYGGEILSVANDLEQSKGRAFDRVNHFLDWKKQTDPNWYDKNITKHTVDTVEMREPYALIRAIPCDPSGEAGGFQSLTVWDELWAYSSERVNRLWTELQPIPNLVNSLRMVVTYAGYYGESELLYSLYEGAVKPNLQTGEPEGKRVEGLEDLPCFVIGDMFVYWDHVPRMPWHTPEFLESAKNDPANKLRPHEYLRLWENRWTTGNEAFLDMEKVDLAMAAGKERGLINNMEGS